MLEFRQTYVLWSFMISHCKEDYHEIGQQILYAGNVLFSPGLPGNTDFTGCAKLSQQKSGVLVFSG